MKIPVSTPNRTTPAKQAQTQRELGSPDASQVRDAAEVEQ
jgi:hypothetical protein